MLIGLALEMLHANWLSSGAGARPLTPRPRGLKVGREALPKETRGERERVESVPFPK